MTFAYSQRVRDSILPLSVGDTLPKAFEEWAFTNVTEDHEEPVEVCELCGQDSLRYHFEIMNHLTHHRLWVGSHCILKFNLSIFENGHRLTPEQAKKKLHRLTEQMHLDSCIAALRAVLQKEPNAILENALIYFQKNKVLTPKYASVVLWRLKANSVNHSPSFFKVCMKRDSHKEDLKVMPAVQLNNVLPALTSSQRRAVKKLRGDQ